MIFSKTKKLSIAFAAIFLFGLALACISDRPAPLALTFLYATNNLGGRIEGVFRIDYNLRESGVFGGGFFQMESVHGIKGHPSDLMADFDLPRFVPGCSTNFQLGIPTNGGRYRLVLVCVPDRKVQFLRSRGGVRLFSFLRGLPLPQRFKAFVLGIRFAVSPCFQTPRPNEVTGANAGGAARSQIRPLWAVRIAQFCR